MERQPASSAAAAACNLSNSSASLNAAWHSFKAFSKSSTSAFSEPSMASGWQTSSRSRSSGPNQGFGSGNERSPCCWAAATSVSRSGRCFLRLSRADSSGHNSRTRPRYSGFRQTGQKSEPSMFWKWRCRSFCKGRRPSRSCTREIGLAFSCSRSRLAKLSRHWTFWILLCDKSSDTNCVRPSKFSIRMIWLLERSSHRKLQHRLTASMRRMFFLERIAWNTLSSSNSPVSCLMYSTDSDGIATAGRMAGRRRTVGQSSR
mmetsp:Transcript_49915/g.116103  ORF Transcript_49915/g.116103 Transcript_49915/m.116103 type:complete len:260 (-) Transcript_49915:13-792(-)